MQKWEYFLVNMPEECNKIIKEECKNKKQKTITSREAFVKYINILGEDGWEFCCVSNEDFLFKRVKGEKIEFHGNLFNDGKQ